MLSLWNRLQSRPVHTALISFMLILLATVLLWPQDGVQQPHFLQPPNTQILAPND